MWSATSSGTSRTTGQVADGYLDAVFLLHLALQGFGQPLAELDRSAGELPQAALVLGLRPPPRQEEPPLAIHNHRPDADADIVNAAFHVFPPSQRYASAEA
jgi:hypothetical protein